LILRSTKSISNRLLAGRRKEVQHPLPLIPQHERPDFSRGHSTLRDPSALPWRREEPKLIKEDISNELTMRTFLKSVDRKRRSNTATTRPVESL
jgi:hypothetical protein